MRTSKTVHTPKSEPVEQAAERILNQVQLAGLLNIKLPTLYSHMSRGVDLPISFRVGSQTRWRESAVWEWIDRREKIQRRKNFED